MSRTGLRIPDLARAQVRRRDQSRCVRCKAPAAYGEWHHRRSRRVRDQFTHSPSNGIWLCKTCHDWVHANRFAAKAQGWLISQWCADPQTEPVTHSLWGRVLLLDTGKWIPHEEQRDDEDSDEDPARS